MKKAATAIIAGTMIFYFTSHGQILSPHTGTGDESKCPYLHPEIAAKTDSASKKTAVVPVVVIDNFEADTSAKLWSSFLDSGTLHSSITTTDSTSRVGKKAAKITFTGTRSKNSWTNLYCKTIIPDQATKVSFWAKAGKECKVQVKLNQGTNHENMEMYGKTISIGTGWKKYAIGIDEFSEFIFSHLKMEGKDSPGKVNKKQVFGVGFAEVDLPVTFFIDQLQWE